MSLQLWWPIFRCPAMFIQIFNQNYFHFPGPCLFKYSNSIKTPFTFLVLKENVQMDEFYGPVQYMIGGRVQKHLFMVLLIICRRNETWKENRVFHIFLIGFPFLPPLLALTWRGRQTTWRGRQTTWSNIAQHDNKHVLAIEAKLPEGSWEPGASILLLKLEENTLGI